MSFVPEVSLGENSRMFIGTASFAFIEGSVEVDPGNIDTGCNLTGGYVTQSRARRKCMVKGSAQWLQNGPTAPLPIILTEGETVNEVFVYPDFVNNSGDYYLLTIAFIGQANVTLNGKEDIKYTFTFMSQGAFGTPSNPSGAFD